MVIKKLKLRTRVLIVFNKKNYGEYINITFYWFISKHKYFDNQ